MGVLNISMNSKLPKKKYKCQGCKKKVKEIPKYFKRKRLCKKCYSRAYNDQKFGPGRERTRKAIELRKKERLKKMLQGLKNE